MIIHIQNKEELEKKLKDAGDKLVVIDFFATWCGPCKIISPKLEALSELYCHDAIVLKIDVDECDDIAQEYNITSMPTFLFIKNNKVIDVFVGGNAEKLSLTMEKLAGDPDKVVANMPKVPIDTEKAVDAATTEQQVAENIS